VVDSPSASQATPRRHRSRQRERILAWLRSTTSHPSAAQIHAALLPDMPALSLGTVYRNLEILVAEGAALAVASATGAARYDANVDPHHHFHCERCDRIIDIEIPVAPALARRLKGRHGFQARRVSVSFFGSCPECEASTSTIRRKSP
jgi:Fe2+ or Zn2+ uptake regulation protein